MDEEGVFDKNLIREFFQLGLMGIEVPEQYGGGGGKFFEAILAGGGLSRADASRGGIVYLLKTLVKKSFPRLATRTQGKPQLPRMTAGTVGDYSLRQARSRSDA